MPRRRRGASGRRPNNRRNHPSPTPASSSQCGSATEASSSARSSPPADQLASISQEIAQKLTFADRMSSKARMPPLRPGNGTVGKKCLVRANHFLVQVADRDIHHYHVTITPCAAEKIKRDVMAQVTRMYGESYLGKRIIAYDGRKSLFTAGPFPFDSKEFIVNLDQDFRASSSTGTRVERKFEVAIKLASKLDFIGLQQFLRQGHLDFHQEVIQVLCAIMRATSREKYLRVRRSFFSPHLGPKGELGDGIEFWRGFYQNLRLTQMGLSLNIDVSARGFYEPILVTDFVKKYMYTKNLSNPLSNRDLVEVLCTKLSPRGSTAVEFMLDDKVPKTSVVQYFREKYGIVLKYTALPALQAGSVAQIYLPMELSRIVEGEQYSKRLNQRQAIALLKATCQRPADRESNITRVVLSNNYNQVKLANEEFGIHVGDDLKLCDARILPSPMLNYHETGREATVNPSLGRWNMINKKMINGGRVEFWTCVCFSKRVNRESPSLFCEQLVNMCNRKGMEFSPHPVIPIITENSCQMEKALTYVHRHSTAEIERRGQPGKQLQLLIIILPDDGGCYGRIKRVCETELGIVTQCCRPQQALKLNMQYFENVALKINVKVGGRNTVLNDAIQRRIPHVSDHPTIIIGAAITHPHPGEDSSPSIAAVVASMDWPEVTKYRCTVSAQPPRLEIIKDLYKTHQDAQRGVVHGGMIRELLAAFKMSTGCKPHRIIFYRDGVSEGQFSQVLLHEVDAIRQACASLEAEYMPPITFVVVQKRHHTRLFPADHKNEQMTDRTGNILPGTVVDTKICHPKEFDFYLNSHAASQGTSRPTHYHVLFDENRFTADELQLLTNNLCYTYARCTRSVSVVPPAYYARLAAIRARYYMEGETSDDGFSGSRGGTRETNLVVQTLPSIKENVKDVMFFC